MFLLVYICVCVCVSYVFCDSRHMVQHSLSHTSNKYVKIGVKIQLINIEAIFTLLTDPSNVIRPTVHGQRLGELGHNCSEEHESHRRSHQSGRSVAWRKSVRFPGVRLNLDRSRPIAQTSRILRSNAQQVSGVRRQIADKICDSWGDQTLH